MRDETHDAAAASWVASANAAETDFPIQNLPFATFRRRGGAVRVGVAIGDEVLDLEAVGIREQPLNDVLARPARERAGLRMALHRLLRSDASPADRERAAHFLTPVSDVELLMPVSVGDYTDFFGSVFHARNAASMLRPGGPFFENYSSMPLGYHGRASSLVVSGTPIRRPEGVVRRSSGVVYAPTRRLDYEAELGFVMGPGNALGSPVPVDRANEHIAGVCLLNDWSARDIQAWESDPLGPFLGKSFATTVSPWVVTSEALEPFRTAGGGGRPNLPAHLVSTTDGAGAALSIEVDVWLLTTLMREKGTGPVRLSRSDTRTLYWTAAQLVAHQTSNGCNLRPGDLLGSGTVSGEAPESWSCLLELTRGGREPIRLPAGDSRTFLEDGDEVTIRGRCSAAGARSIGFGECRGRVTPASERA